MYDTMIFSDTYEMIKFLNESDAIYINHERIDGFILLICYYEEEV